MITRETFYEELEDKLSTCIKRRTQLGNDLDECDKEIMELLKMINSPKSYETYCRWFKQTGRTELESK